MNCKRAIYTWLIGEHFPIIILFIWTVFFFLFEWLHEPISIVLVKWLMHVKKFFLFSIWNFNTHAHVSNQRYMCLTNATVRGPKKKYIFLIGNSNPLLMFVSLLNKRKFVNIRVECKHKYLKWEFSDTFRKEKGVAQIFFFCFPRNMIGFNKIQRKIYIQLPVFFLLFAYNPLNSL